MTSSSSSSPEVKSKKYKKRKRSRSSSYEDRKHIRKSEKDHKRSSRRKGYESKRRGATNNNSNKSTLTSAHLKLHTQKALQHAVSSDNPSTNNNVNTSLQQQQQRLNSIQLIENDTFQQAAFLSKRSEIPLPQESRVDSSHQNAMFNNNNNNMNNVNNKYGSSNKKFIYNSNNPLCMFHPCLLASTDDKLQDWKKKLARLRKAKLNLNDFDVGAI